MDENSESTDEVLAKLIDMGFEGSQLTEAIAAVGSSLNNAIDYILNSSSRNSTGVSTRSNCSAVVPNGRALGKISSSTSLRQFGQMRQSSIMDHLQTGGKPKKNRTKKCTGQQNSKVVLSARNGLGQAKVEMHHIIETLEPNHTHESSELPCTLSPLKRTEVDTEIGPDWSQKAEGLLQKHFGYKGLKSFQKEALSAWLAHQDCLVLAATGSGKSLCFQLPALLTGKVVVVISPLISLMHDQCLKLSKHGISACFLGSGQPDSSVEKKAMNGMYSIIYVCPETVLRLIGPLQRLAENCGITLFAIDEVHCVSKWGHDFRPDYRRLSVLRESFSVKSLKFLEYDVPIMALTATATTHVREDILESLCMSGEAKVVLTSFYRPNLHFSVKHSRTTSPTSYVNDFNELIQIYTGKRIVSESSRSVVTDDLEDAEHSSSTSTHSSDDETEDGDFDELGGEVNSLKNNGSSTSKERQLSVEYLEDDFDDIQEANDFDVSYGEFCGQSPINKCKIAESSELPNSLLKPAQKPQSMHGPLEHGPTIIYVPTRKETLRIAKFLCSKGVKAAAYNAGLAKSHLRRVHMEFHEDTLDVVVATIAFGMGIDKLNVRRIVHYGWPQSLEAYYQEAGRAGRDGKSANCILYANLSRVPTLLPNKRSHEQKTNAYKMLSDCFKYGMNTCQCRAKILVEYFGETFSPEKCTSCDVCRNGPPELQNFKEEANIFMQVVVSYYNQLNSYDNFTISSEKPDLRMFVTKIREHSQKFVTTDHLWWRGLARALEDTGFIKEKGDSFGVQVRFPEPTDRGLRFLEFAGEKDFYAYPEADMLLASTREEKPFSSFSEWGRGWADPEIRRQRLGKMKSKKKTRKGHKRKFNSDTRTVRGRLTAKLSKQKR